MYIDYTLNEMIQSVWVIFNILLFFFCSNLWYVCAGPLLLSPFWRKWVCHGLLNPHYFACTMFTFTFDAHKVNIDNIDRIDWTYWIETTKISDLSERSQNTLTHTHSRTYRTNNIWMRWHRSSDKFDDSLQQLTREPIKKKLYRQKKFHYDANISIYPRAR